MVFVNKDYIYYYYYYYYYYYFVIQRHNELRDLEAEMLRMVCNGVETEPVLRDITGEELNRGANTAPDARLDIVARGVLGETEVGFL